MRLDYLIDEIRTAWSARIHPDRPPHPPRRLIDTVGGGDFEKLGQELFQLVLAQTGLRPDEQLLDVGCGCGRLAVPMMGYFGAGGYRGFDVMPKLIRWCDTHIARRDPHFAFTTVDVRNRYYNPRGAVEANAVRFPYPDATFDVAIATSVFTHLLPDTYNRYLAESARVLKPGGRLFATFFVSNPATAAALAQQREGLSFRHAAGFYALEDETRPELAVCYQEDYLRRQLEASNLRVREPIQFGSWRNPQGSTLKSEYQDRLVAIKI